MKNKRILISSSLLSMLLIGCSGQQTKVATSDSRNADDLLIVDCLLPGQVRQLGMLATYLTAKRAIKTSASDCAIRGGEFVPPGKATYQTALNAWLPRAELGDPEAQAYVGEIYEKGYGRPPDYELAAIWYKKAADQGNVRAQVSLGYLYEKGLGVKADKNKAIQLYADSVRKQNVPFASTIATPEQNIPEQVRVLKTELKNSEVERAGLTESLASTRKKLDASQQKIEKLQQIIRQIKERIRRDGLPQSGNLQKQLQAQQARLKQEKNTSQNLNGKFQKEILALKDTLHNTERRAKQLAGELRKQHSQANNLQIRLLETEAILAKKEKELIQQKNQFESKLAQVSANHERLQAEKQQKGEQVKEETAKLSQQLLAQRNKIKQLEQEKKNYLAQLKQLEKDIDEKVVVAKPSIEIIDPSFIYNGGVATIKLRSVVKNREIFGKVDTPVGLLSLLVNDVRKTVDDNGIFHTSLTFADPVTPVSIVAIDKHGQKSSLDFVVSLENRNVMENASSPAVSKPSISPWRDLNFGHYHALVIGNNKYQKVPSLDTPVSDAKAVAEILKKKYGFEVELLLNATRYEILSAMNRFRSVLTENDNLLIYYAGHGELDKVNMRGHWLPVDADADNNANWISTVAISDILNAMSSRHVLVIADSCYSGAMTRSSLARLQPGMDDSKKIDWIKAMLKAKSRTVLTSGGLKPVLDGGGGQHSVFAKALITALQNNDTLLEGQTMYREVSAGIVSIAAQYGIEQVPEYAPIRYSGHEAGDFFLVPQS